MNENCPLSRKVLRRPLARLLEAYKCAADVNSPHERFAVRIDELRRNGVSDVTLQWLCEKGYVQHLIETTQQTDSERRHKRIPTTGFGKTSCFILTERGMDFSGWVFESRSGEAGSIGGSERVPQWDGKLRELRVGKVVIKTFRQPAPVQECVLAVFQEDGWPHSIDDPLPPKDELDCRQRLHDAIRLLKQHHQISLIRFHGDGTGERVVWVFLDS